MLNVADLDELERLGEVATAGPWYVRAMDDDMCMGAVAIATKPNTSGDNDDLCESAFHGVVAATLIQDRNYVNPEIDQSTENAELIAAFRNSLPELIRLARLAIDAPLPLPGESRDPTPVI